jgi:hypothetical protein
VIIYCGLVTHILINPLIRPIKTPEYLNRRQLTASRASKVGALYNIAKHLFRKKAVCQILEQ